MWPWAPARSPAGSFSTLLTGGAQRPPPSSTSAPPGGLGLAAAPPGGLAQTAHLIKAHLIRSFWRSCRTEKMTQFTFPTPTKREEKLFLSLRIGPVPQLMESGGGVGGLEWGKGGERRLKSISWSWDSLFRAKYGER